jgi:hypothetical protein
VSRSTITLLLLATGCMPRGGDDQLPPQPIPSSELPASLYVADELQTEIHTITDLTRYPPTACRLQHLLGDAFEQLEASGGFYPSENEASDGGFSYFGMACPQPECDSAMVWVHPDGGMVVALHRETSLELVTNRPALRDRLPAAIERFVADVPASSRAVSDQVLPDPPQCRTPDIDVRRQRFVRAKQKLSCDRDYSDFWTPAAVVPSEGERSYFHTEASADTRRMDFVVAGDLVVLGWKHAEDPHFACAEYISLDGKRTTGWLQAADVVELTFTLHPPSRTELERLVLDQPASWLIAGTQRQLGELVLEREAGERVRVDVERTMNGHLCGIRGTLRLAAPRVLEDVDTGCGTVGLVFNNAVALWEDDDYGCSGARASCSGAYLNYGEALKSGD